jgi:transcriptional regulator with XRE-family HTH domain
MKNLSSVLASLMSQHRLTSSELARQTGIAQPVIYRLVTGTTENPQIMTLKPIADYFKISIDQVLGLTSLNHPKVLDNDLMHTITNKLVVIKTVSNILMDITPSLIDGYKKALSAKLINESTPVDILPLIQINISNLLKAAISIQNLLQESEKNSEVDL